MSYFNDAQEVVRGYPCNFFECFCYECKAFFSLLIIQPGDLDLAQARDSLQYLYNWFCVVFLQALALLHKLVCRIELYFTVIYLYHVLFTFFICKVIQLIVVELVVQQLLVEAISFTNEVPHSPQLGINSMMFERVVVVREDLLGEACWYAIITLALLIRKDLRSKLLQQLLQDWFGEFKH